MSDLYKVLGVARDADEAELKAAHRKLSKKHHPDQNPGDKVAENMFKACQNAYDILIKPDKRAKYERGELRGFPPPPLVDAAIPLEGFINGTDFVLTPLFFKVSRRRTVRVDAGRRPGAILAVPDEDLYVRIGCQKHHDFSIEGDDLHAGITLTSQQAEAGVNIRLNLPHGKKIIQIPAATRNGDVVTVANLGLPAGPRAKGGNLKLALRVFDKPAAKPKSASEEDPADYANVEFNAENFPRWAEVIRKLKDFQP